MDTLEAGIDLNATISGHTPFHITIPIFISTLRRLPGNAFAAPQRPAVVRIRL
jgi:hypothetical protein